PEHTFRDASEARTSRMHFLAYGTPQDFVGDGVFPHPLEFLGHDVQALRAALLLQAFENALDRRRSMLARRGAIHGWLSAFSNTATFSAGTLAYRSHKQTLHLL